MNKTKKTARSKSVKNDNNQVSLSSREICKIIKQCRESGVLSLSIEGLDITLEEAVKKPIPLPQEPEELPKAAQAEEVDIPLEDTPVGEEAAQLMILEPEAYEDLWHSEDVRITGDQDGRRRQDS